MKIRKCSQCFPSLKFYYPQKLVLIKYPILTFMGRFVLIAKHIPLNNLPVSLFVVVLVQSCYHESQL